MPAKRRTHIHLTLWKAGTCFLAVGLMVATIAVLDAIIPGDGKDCVARPVNGGVEYTIRNMKSGAIGVAFVLSIFGYPPLIFWLFWKQLGREYESGHGRADPKARDHWLVKMIVYPLVGLLIVFAAWILIFFALWEPFYSAFRITVRGDDIKVESLYGHWQLARREIRKVDLSRREHRKGRGGPHASYRAAIEMRDGGRIDTPVVDARPLGGQEDQQYTDFFAQLRAELTK